MIRDNPFENIKYTDKYGKEISYDELIKLYSSPDDYKIIKKTISNKRIISTVWLPYSHGIFGEEHFETMVFGYDPKNEKTDYGDEYECERYETIEQAIAGHEEMVKFYL